MNIRNYHSIHTISNQTPFLQILHIKPLQCIFCRPCGEASGQVWGLSSRFHRFRYFPNFSTSPKYMLATEYHVHIWQVSPQLSCDDRGFSSPAPGPQLMKKGNTMERQIWICYSSRQHIDQIPIWSAKLSAIQRGSDELLIDISTVKVLFIVSLMISRRRIELAMGL